MKDYSTSRYSDMRYYAQMMNKYGVSNMDPVIITCAITGALQGKEANPNIPETVEEQVQQTYDAYNAGASMVHIHRRDPQNTSLMSFNHEDYIEVNRAIREKCPDIIINNTMVAAHRCDSEKLWMGPPQFGSLGAKAEVASLDITPNTTKMYQKARPGFPGREEGKFWNWQLMISPDEMVQGAEKMIKDGAKPEIEIFNLRSMRHVNHIIENAEGMEPPHWVSLIVGGGNGEHPTPEMLSLAGRLIPDDTLLNIIGVGATQTAVITMAMIMGYHVRVGLEDNAYYGRGELAKSNAQLVERAVKIAELLGRPVATPKQAREMMGLGAPRQY